MATKTFRATFEIVEKIGCPLYEKGERMELTDKTFSCPEGKEVCLILVRDMTQLLFGLLKAPDAGGAVSATIYNCSGCTGLIKFSQVLEDVNAPAAGSTTTKVATRIQSVMQEVHGRAVDSAFLRALPAEKIDPVIRTFQEVEVPKGRVLVHQGEPNPNIYLVMTGSFCVENNRQVIATLGAGELFGEMSYLGVGPAVASIRAIAKATVLAIRGDAFGRLLSSSTSVQAYMARLLAERLQQINMMRVRDFECAMSGKIADVMPAELLQVFHMHQKTGVLLLDLPGGKGRVVFREGGVVQAQYGSRKNEEAVYGILAEKKGYYRFTAGSLSAGELSSAEIGDFMALLMEGIRRVDEDGPEQGDDDMSD